MKNIFFLTFRLASNKNQISSFSFAFLLPFIWINFHRESNIGEDGNAECNEFERKSCRQGSFTYDVHHLIAEKGGCLIHLGRVVTKFGAIFNSCPGYETSLSYYVQHVLLWNIIHDRLLHSYLKTICCWLSKCLKKNRVLISVLRMNK